jgi:predicted ATPase
VLLERERELERIDAALGSAIAGSGITVVIEGEPGIGKTSLLAAALSRAAASGVVALRACGAELESEFPFGVLRQCLEPVVTAADDTERARLFAGVAALAEPVLTDVPGAGADASFGVLHGLYWLLANLCERGPVLMTVDDAHWADEASLRFLAYLQHRAESLALVLLVATRTVDREGSASGVLTALLADPSSAPVTVPALSEHAVAELIGEPVDHEFARACHHATGGNPFLLTELLGTLHEQRVPFTAAGAERVATVAPPQVARSIRARLARLEPDASGLARALALLGDQAPLDIASELAGLTAPEGARAAEIWLSGHDRR